MFLLKIKPLSANNAFMGKKVKTADYRVFEEELLYTLPRLVVPDGKLIFTAVVGYSYKGADIDNFLKPFIDVLQKKYDFNDSRIYRLIVDKVCVKKGDEFIKFSLKALDDDVNILNNKEKK